MAEYFDARMTSVDAVTSDDDDISLDAGEVGLAFSADETSIIWGRSWAEVEKVLGAALRAVERAQYPHG